ALVARTRCFLKGLFPDAHMGLLTRRCSNDVALRRIANEGMSMITRRSLGFAAVATAMSAPTAMAQQADNAALLATLLKLEAESWQFLKERNVAAAKDYLGDD